MSRSVETEEVESVQMENVTLVQRAVLAAASVLEEAQDELCRLDAAAGDGDEGMAMAAAARGVKKRVAEQPPTSVAELVTLAADELGSVGGAMGALSYLIVTSVGAHLDEEGRSFSPESLVTLLGAAEESVSSFGGAARGDKSVLDAIGPARDAAEDAARSGVSAPEATSAAAAAAREGAQATAEMVARIGRASRLGERSRGAVDAGALTFALVLSALAEVYAAEEEKPA